MPTIATPRLHRAIAAGIFILTACTTAPAPTAPSVATHTSHPEPPTLQHLTPTPTSVRPTRQHPTPSATSIPPSPSPLASTPTPTRSTPTQVPVTATPQATIHHFEANVDLADPGETITLTWYWTGGTGGTIYHLMPTGQLTDRSWDVVPVGSLQYTIPPERRNYDTLALFVYDDAGLLAQATLSIQLRCPDEWFFSPAPDICPAGPPTLSDGAEQPFQRGTMLWNRAEGLIYVLFDDAQYGRWQASVDQWSEGDPVADPQLDPPSGLYQPVRGFGLLWHRDPTIRERLGWAVAPEEGYRTAVQSTSHFRYRRKYIRALDGGVWRLGPNGSAWEYVAPLQD